MMEIENAANNLLIFVTADLVILIDTLKTCKVSLYVCKKMYQGKCKGKILQTQRQRRVR